MKVKYSSDSKPEVCHTVKNGNQAAALKCTRGEKASTPPSTPEQITKRASLGGGGVLLFMRLEGFLFTSLRSHKICYEQYFLLLVGYPCTESPLLPTSRENNIITMNKTSNKCKHH